MDTMLLSSVVLAVLVVCGCVRTVRSQTNSSCTRCPEACVCFHTHNATDNNTLTIRVDCSGNELTRISISSPVCTSDNTQDNITNVRYDLDFSDNRIQHATLDSLHEIIASVVVLDLSSNHLTNISEFPLTSMTSLRALYLHNNSLVELPKTFWRKIPDPVALERVSLHDNPWACYCQLNWLPLWLSELGEIVVSVNRTTCDSPGSLEGIPIVETDASDWPCTPETKRRTRLPPYAIAIIVLGTIYLLVCTICALCVSLRNRQKVKAAPSDDVTIT